MFLLFSIFTIESKRYWEGEEETVQELADPENAVFEMNRPLFYIEDQKDSTMKRSSLGNIRLLRKKNNEPKVGIRLLQI